MNKGDSYGLLKSAVEVDKDKVNTEHLPSDIRDKELVTVTLPPVYLVKKEWATFLSRCEINNWEPSRYLEIALNQEIIATNKDPSMMHREGR